MNQSKLRRLLMGFVLLAFTVDFIPSSFDDNYDNMGGPKSHECGAGQSVAKGAKGLLKGCKSAGKTSSKTVKGAKNLKTPNTGTKPVKGIRSMKTEYENHVVFPKSTLLQSLDIRETLGGFEIGGDIANTRDEIIQALSKQIKKKHPGQSVDSKIRFRVYDGELRCRAVLGNLEHYISSSHPNLSCYDFSKATFTTGNNIMGKTYTTVTIPCKTRKVYAGVHVGRLDDYNLSYDIDDEYLEEVKFVLKNLFKQGGILTRSRLDKALKEANIPSSAISGQCETFYFADLFFPSSIDINKHYDGNEYYS